MTDAYNDIINLPHPTSKKHPRMPALNRAVQFAPFAALAGHDAAIREVARLTDMEIEISDDAKAELTLELQLIADNLPCHPPVCITYFLSDENKDGGAYVTASGHVKKIDDIQRKIIMTSGTQIPIDNIYKIEAVL